MSEKDVPIRSISRALAVLQAINRHGSLTITEAARAVDVPYPTACRIIQTLIHEGMIEREKSRKRYHATALSQSLSCGFQANSRLVGAARPHIVRLTKDISWPASVSIRVGASMVIQDSTHALTTLTFSDYHPGFTLPVTASASGLVYLAFSSPDTRAELLSQLARSKDLQVDGGRSGVLDSFDEAFFESIAERGYATYVRNRYTKDPGKTSSIAVPLLANGEVMGALAIVYFSSSMKSKAAIEKYMGPLADAQAAINQSLHEARDHLDS
ncbi:MAG: helix-turn-helix domain-containing protein [Caulobacterales bacterium]|nr:helix-turn-helix domain-containing protein [Caulobacterales bacterium]